MFKMIEEDHVMVDIETLSTNQNATIVQLGACLFNKEGIKDTFLINVDSAEAKKYNTHISRDTLEWWAKQDKEIRLSWQVDKKSLPDAMNSFNDWIGQYKKINVWANGLAFDMSVIRWSFEQCEIARKWDYWKEFDSRTINALFDYKLPKAGTTHNALDDATHQATHLLKLFKSFSE